MILDSNKLNDVIKQKNEILKTKPFPHFNAHGLIKDEYFQQLKEEDPEIISTAKHGIDLLDEKSFNIHMYSYNDFLQSSDKDVKYSELWKEFVNELENGGEYKNFVSEFTKVKNFHFEYEWSYKYKFHIKPHPDGDNKVFTQLFYLLDENNWKNEWGGHTSIFWNNKDPLWKAKKFLTRSRDREEFNDFKNYKSPQIIGNYSFFFLVSLYSMHGVFPYDTTEQGKYLRKVFFPIVVKG